MVLRDRNDTYAMMLAFGNLTVTVAWFGLTFGSIMLELWDSYSPFGYHESKNALNNSLAAGSSAAALNAALVTARRYL